MWPYSALAVAIAHGFEYRRGILHGPQWGVERAGERVIMKERGGRRADWEGSKGSEAGGHG